jgi:hypothetical protein
MFLQNWVLCSSACSHAVGIILQNQVLCFSACNNAIDMYCFGIGSYVFLLVVMPYFVFRTLSIKTMIRTGWQVLSELSS